MPTHTPWAGLAALVAMFLLPFLLLLPAPNLSGEQAGAGAGIRSSSSSGSRGENFTRTY